MLFSELKEEKYKKYMKEMLYLLNKVDFSFSEEEKLLLNEVKNILE